MCSVISFSGGWIDIEREDIDQECNWALVSIGSCLSHQIGRASCRERV